jgi:hypothetical protein
VGLTALASQTWNEYQQVTAQYGVPNYTLNGDEVSRNDRLLRHLV